MKIWFIKARPHWPVGNAGAVVVASTSKEAEALGSTLGSLDAEKPVALGSTSSNKARVVFFNTGDY